MVGFKVEDKNTRNLQDVKSDGHTIENSNIKHILQYTTMYKSRKCPGKVYLGYSTIGKYDMDNLDISLIDETFSGKDEYLKEFCDICGYVLYDTDTNGPQFHMVADESLIFIKGSFRKRIEMDWNGENYHPVLYFNSCNGEMELRYLDLFLENQVTCCYEDKNSMLKNIGLELESRINRYSSVNTRVRKR